MIHIVDHQNRVLCGMPAAECALSVQDQAVALLSADDLSFLCEDCAAKHHEAVECIRRSERREEGLKSLLRKGVSNSRASADTPVVLDYLPGSSGEDL